MSAEDDDAKLVALIDRQLDEDARRALEARLAVEPDLRARLAFLRDGGRPFAPAFQALLDAAPIERLKASLVAVEAADRAGLSPRRRLTPRVSRFGVAAALVLFCAGIAVGRVWSVGTAHPSQTSAPAADRDEDWRQTVVEYMGLYTVDTFSTAGEPAIAALAAVGAKLGVNLAPERVALARMQFVGAQIFNFHDHPLGQLAYVDPTTGPVVFCIFSDFEPDAAMKVETREDFSAASWARAGRGYMLIGRAPVDQMAELAESLERRF
jgi:anti-sigma factor RsiW